MNILKKELLTCGKFLIFGTYPSLCPKRSSYRSILLFTPLFPSVPSPVQLTVLQPNAMNILSLLMSFMTAADNIQYLKKRVIFHSANLE